MKETTELNSVYNVKSTIFKCIYTEINSAAYIARKNIAQQNIFIKRSF